MSDNILKWFYFQTIIAVHLCPQMSQAQDIAGKKTLALKKPLQPDILL
jgi:hypothetical protein